MIQRNVTFDEVEQVINLLQDQSAWQSRAGSGTGSIFTLQFGPALSVDKNQGEFSLMVYCAWRIVEGNNILCTWHGDSDSVLAPALKNLEGLQVIKATLSEWGDLTIDFNGELSLQIWNDAPFADSDSWFIGYQGIGYYCIEADKGFLYELSNK